MNPRGARRITADDYEAWMAGLCGMPPGPAREGYVREFTQRLLEMYAGYDATPPAGLCELAQRISVEIGGSA